MAVPAELPSDPLARARALMASGPPVEVAPVAEEEDDWRSQLSDIGRTYSGQRFCHKIRQHLTPDPGSD